MNAEPKPIPTLEQVLADWKEGKPVLSLRLGHDHQDIRQDLAHQLAFHLMESFSGSVPASFPIFLQDAARISHSLPGTLAPTKEEFEAAYSLAWATLKRGWSAAIGGHADQQYISISSGKN